MSDYPPDKQNLQADSTAPPPYNSRPNSLSHPPNPQASQDLKQDPNLNAYPPPGQRGSPSPNPHYQNITTAAPSSSNPTPRLLHIYVDGIRHRHVFVCDSDKTTRLYTVQNHFYSAFTSKPSMEISCGQTQQSIGTADFGGAFTRRISLTVNGRALELSPVGLFSRSYTFPSSIGMLKWKHEGAFTVNLCCVTERGEWVARFDNTTWSMKKEGKLEIVDRGMPKGVLDEVVVSGLAMIEHERRRRSNASAGGGGGGA